MTIDDNVKYIYKGTTPVNEIYQGSILVWPTSPQRDYSQEYLTFEILTGGTISFRYVVWEGASYAKTIYYSLDSGSTWTSWTNSSTGTPISVQAGDVVMVKGNNSAYGEEYKVAYITSTASFNVYGNIMSLVGGDNFTGITALTTDYTFRNLFATSKVVSASNLVLPARTLSDNCYYGLFSGCLYLESAPKLPATSLTSFCYAYMFRNCSSLRAAPRLPATSLAVSCYEEMFFGCDSLTTAPALPATGLNAECYSKMFQGCIGLTSAPALPAETLAIGCYQYMFGSCRSLSAAPELPATTMEYGCYRAMFVNCVSLTTSPDLYADTLAGFCYAQMFQGCTGIETAPELLVATLEDGCYQDMFKGFSNLNYIKCLATSFGTLSTSGWVDGVAASGTFVKDPTASWSTSIAGIPTGWTVVDNE